MTTMRFYHSQNRIKGFSCEGHSGYAEEGADIVCAAVSSAVELAECTLNDVLHAGAFVSVDEKKAKIIISLPDGYSNETSCQAVLQGLYLYACALSKEYPEYFHVMEV